MKKLRNLTAKQLRDIGPALYDAQFRIRKHHQALQVFSDLLITGKSDYHERCSQENSRLDTLTGILYQIFDIAFSVNDRGHFNPPELMSSILDKYVMADRITPSVKSVTIVLSSELEGAYTSSSLFVTLVHYLATCALLVDTTLTAINLSLEEQSHEDPGALVISSIIRTKACTLEEPERIFESSTYTHLSRALYSQIYLTGLEPTAAKAIAWRLGGEVHCDLVEKEIQISATIPYSSVIE